MLWVHLLLNLIFFRIVYGYGVCHELLSNLEQLQSNYRNESMNVKNFYGNVCLAKTCSTKKTLNKNNSIDAQSREGLETKHFELAVQVRYNLIHMFGKILHYGAYHLNSHFYHALFNIQTALKLNNLNFLLISATLRDIMDTPGYIQYEKLFEKLQEALPPYLKCSAQLWKEGIENGDISANELLSPENIVDNIFYQLDYTTLETFPDASLVLVAEQGKYEKLELSYNPNILNVINAIKKTQNKLDPPMFSVLLEFLPRPIDNPQLEESMQFLAKFFKFNSIENWDKYIEGLQGQKLRNPRTIIKTILGRVRQDDSLPEQAHHNAEIVLGFSRYDFPTGANTHVKTLIKTVKGAEPDVKMLLKYVNVEDYPLDIVLAAFRVQYYLEHNIINPYILDGFNSYIYTSGLEILVATLARMVNSGQLQGEVFLSVNSVYSYTLFKLRNQQGPVLPTLDLLNAQTILLGVESPDLHPKLKKAIRKLQKYAIKNREVIHYILRNKLSPSDFKSPITASVAIAIYLQKYMEVELGPLTDCTCALGQCQLNIEWISQHICLEVVAGLIWSQILVCTENGKTTTTAKTWLKSTPGISEEENVFTTNVHKTTKRTRPKRTKSTTPESIEDSDENDSTTMRIITTKRTRPKRTRSTTPESIEDSDENDSTTMRIITTKRTRPKRTRSTTPESTEDSDENDSTTMRLITTKRTRPKRTRSTTPESIEDSDENDSTTTGINTTKRTKPKRTRSTTPESIEDSDENDSTTMRIITTKRTRPKRTRSTTPESIEDSDENDSTTMGINTTKRTRPKRTRSTTPARITENDENDSTTMGIITTKRTRPKRTRSTTVSASGKVTSSKEDNKTTGKSPPGISTQQQPSQNITVNIGLTSPERPVSKTPKYTNTPSTPRRTTPCTDISIIPPVPDIPKWIIIIIDILVPRPPCKPEIIIIQVFPEFVGNCHENQKELQLLLTIINTAHFIMLFTTTITSIVVSQCEGLWFLLNLICSSHVTELQIPSNLLQIAKKYADMLTILVAKILKWKYFLVQLILCIPRPIKPQQVSNYMILLAILKKYVTIEIIKKIVAGQATLSQSSLVLLVLKYVHDSHGLTAEEKNIIMIYIKLIQGQTTNPPAIDANINVEDLFMKALKYPMLSPKKREDFKIVMEFISKNPQVINEWEDVMHYVENPPMFTRIALLRVLKMECSKQVRDAVESLLKTLTELHGL